MVFNTTFSKISVISWQSAIEDLTVTIIATEDLTVTIIATEDLTVTIMENNNTNTVPWLLL